MGMSDYLENKSLDFWYGKQFTTAPANIYVQAHTGNPGEAGTSNVHATFARATLVNNGTNWPAASGGSKSNGTKISWGSTTGVLGLADVTHVSLWDALSGGNCLDYGQLDAALAVSDRTEVAILPGALVITRA